MYMRKVVCVSGIIYGPPLYKYWDFEALKGLSKLRFYNLNLNLILNYRILLKRHKYTQQPNPLNMFQNFEPL